MTSAHHPETPTPAEPRSRGQRVGLWLGPLLFALTLLLDLEPGRPEVTRMAAAALLMATWWITDAIPLYATALLPLILYPLLGIEQTRATAPIYFNSTIVLFLGGFMIALTFGGLHDRPDHGEVGRPPADRPVGHPLGGGRAGADRARLHARRGLPLHVDLQHGHRHHDAPVGLAVILRMEEQFGKEKTRTFSVAVMLGIAYACSAGGIATLVGTPPNLSLERIFQITFPEAPPITFGVWFVMAAPISALMLACAWVLITQVFFRIPGEVAVDREVLESEARKLGAVSFEERVILAVFAATAVLWVFRVPIEIGGLTIPGWSTLLPYGHLIDDGTVAIAMAGILFLVPARSPGARSRTVMGPDVVRGLPWNIVLLFGGGFALAHGFQTTGLARFIGGGFSGLGSVPPIVLILVICLSITFLTELTSNTATTEMVLPIFAAVAVSTGLHPLLLMIPATLSASCAFMMPVATPPNAVVFGSDRVKISEMARVGLVLNLVGAVVITLIFRALGPHLFGIEPGVLPDWAHAGG